MSRAGQFLYALHTSNIPLRVGDLQISARKEGTDDLQIQLGVATIFEAPANATPRVARVTSEREAVQ